jgi:hypothetical protein
VDTAPRSAASHSCPQFSAHLPGQRGTALPSKIRAWQCRGGTISIVGPPGCVFMNSDTSYTSARPTTSVISPALAGCGGGGGPLFM